MSRLVWAGLVGAGLAVAPVVSAPRPKDGPSSLDFIPAEVGTTWVYDVNNGDSVYVVRVAAVEEKEGARVISLEKRGTTKWLPAERLVVSARGIQKVEFAGFAVEPYFKLKFPIKAADSWGYEYPPQAGLIGVKATVTVVGEEEVRLPAGKYKAVKIEQLIKEENGKPLTTPRTLRSWWVEGIGMVKATENTGGLLVLKSIRRGER